MSLDLCIDRASIRRQGALFRDWAGVARLNEELPALEVLDLRCVAAPTCMQWMDGS